MKHQQARIAALTLNITNLEYQQVEGQINRLMGHQRKTMLKQEISEFAMGVKTLIREISPKHNQQCSIRPTRELVEHMGRINTEVLGIMLPELHEPDQIFDAHIAAT